MRQDIKVLRDLFETEEDEQVELNRRATEDLSYIASQLRYGLFHNVNYRSLQREGEKLCDFLVIGHDLAKSKKAVFPSQHIKFNDEEGQKVKMYVAVVTYENDKAKNTYLFDGALFKKAGLLSIFGMDKKKGVASVDLSNNPKLEKYSFGRVVESFGGGSRGT